MRAIDADTLLEKVEKIQPWEPYLGKYAQGIRHCMEIVSLLIRDAPTIESSAQPERPKGEWITDDLSGLIHCSKCGNDAPMETTGGGQYKSKFCPSCGAKMEEREE